MKKMLLLAALVSLPVFADGPYTQADSPAGDASTSSVMGSRSTTETSTVTTDDRQKMEDVRDDKIKSYDKKEKVKTKVDKKVSR